MNYSNIKDFFKRKFVSDSILTIVSHIFIGTSGLIVNSIIGIYYGVNGLGIFSQGISIYFILSIFANFGLETSAQKHSAQFCTNQSKLKKIFINSFYATLITSVITTAIFYLVLILFPQIFKTPEILSFVKLMCLATPLFAINKTMNAFNVGLRKINIYALIRTTRWILIVFGILFYSKIGLSITSIPKIFIFSELGLAIFLIFINKYYWSSIEVLELKLHLSFGIKNMLGNFSNELNLRAPIIIIGQILGDSQAGFFAYVISFARAVVLIPQAIQKTFNPIFTKNWYDQNHKQNEININKVFKHNLISIIPVFFMLYIFFIIYTSLFMDTKYLNLSPILLVLLIGMATTYLFGPFMTFFAMTGYLYINILRIIIPAIINIMLIFSLMNEYGNMGVAIAVSISMIFHLFFMDFLYKKYLKIHLFKYTIFRIRS